MSTNHTPGPWRSEGKSIKAIDHGNWFTIARVESQKLTDEGNSDNARLIAAAPELLAALYETVEHLEMTMTYLPTTISGDKHTLLYSECEKRIKEARAAIMKAKGE